MKIIVTGSLAFDQIMNFPGGFSEHIMPDKLHCLSVSFLVDKLHNNFGGVAGNISYNLGLLGRKPLCFSCCGKDGGEYKQFLQTHGVDISLLKTVDDSTAKFTVITDQKDNQIAGFYPGAMRQDVELSLENIPEISSKDFLVISPTMPDAMANFIQQAQKLKIPYLFSPAQQIPRLEKEVLLSGIMGTEILIGNDYEIALLQQKTGLSTQDILQHVKILITTLGEKGSQFEQLGKPTLSVGVASVSDVKDPTGAGDAYIAGFLAAYTQGKDLKTCGQWGATTSAYAVENYGTTAHNFSLSEFKKRLGENFK